MIAPEVLLHVPGCEDGRPPLSIGPPGPGLLNVGFRVMTAAGHFIVRLHGAPDGAPTVDRAREARLHAVAAQAGLAPALVHADPAGRFLISELLPGRTWTRSDITQAASLARLAATLRVLHGLTPPAVAPLDIPGTLRSYLARIVRAAPGEAGRLEALLGRAAAVLSECGSAGRAPAIVHGDLHHSNVLESRRLYLIDWEYAAVADPLFDLGCLVAYYPEAAAHAPLLLAESGLAGAATTRELAEAAWLYVLLSYLWFRARRCSREASAAERALEEQLAARLETGAAARISAD